MFSGLTVKLESVKEELLFSDGMEEGSSTARLQPTQIRLANGEEILLRIANSPGLIQGQDIIVQNQDIIINAPSGTYVPDQDLIINATNLVRDRRVVIDPSASEDDLPNKSNFEHNSQEFNSAERINKPVSSIKYVSYSKVLVNSN